MNTAARILAPLFLAAFLMSSCHTAQKYVESGDYDNAIDFCIRKLKGKSKKKLEYVQRLELAFRKAQARDLGTIAQLKVENRPELWEEWTENGTLEKRLDEMASDATEMAERPSTNPKPDEALVRVGALHLVNAWAALMASNFLTSLQRPLNRCLVGRETDLRASLN